MGRDLTGGTWTPSGIGSTLSTVSGKWTKQGSVYTCWGRATVDSNAVGTDIEIDISSIDNLENAIGSAEGQIIREDNKLIYPLSSANISSVQSDTAWSVFSEKIISFSFNMLSEEFV